MTAQALPSDVTDQVPEAKQLLFVKLPDRIILIDPDTKLVHEIVLNSKLDHHGIEFQQYQPAFPVIAARSKADILDARMATEVS